MVLFIQTQTFKHKPFLSTVLIFRLWLPATRPISVRSWTTRKKPAASGFKPLPFSWHRK